MPDPEGDAQLRDVPGHGKDVGVVFAGEAAGLFGVDLFQVKDDEAGGLHQRVKLGQIGRVVGAERLTGCVQRGVHALGAGKLEELRHEVHLPQRFAAADGDAAFLAPVIAVAPDVLEQLLRRPFRAALSAPRFGVVAVFAAQGTALQKDNEPDTRPVHRAEAFQRVDETDRVTVRHGRYGRSRPSAARGSGR